MKIRFVITLAIVLSAIGFGLSSNFQTAECRCATASFKNAYKQSKAVFVGEVVGEEKNGDTKTFNFKVEKYWKGANAKNIEIDVYETQRYQAWFKKGEKYLIYADEYDGKLRVSRCSRSRETANAKDDLQKLGKGKIPR